MSIRSHRRGRNPRYDSRHRIGATIRVILLAAVFVGLLATGVALYVKGQVTRTHTDPTTLCSIDGSPTEVLVLLFDMSDQISEPQKLMIRNELQQLRAGIAPLGLIEAFSVDGMGQQVAVPLVHLCNPGTGSDMSRLYQNPALARRRWNDFDKQLDSQLNRLLDSPQSSASAIFEAVQATALRTFNQPEYEGVPQQLVVVSDLLQHMPGKLSQYQGIQSFEEFEQSAYFAEVRADLTDVHVTLLYIVRPQTPQRWPDHIQFWEKYFLVQGAIVDRVEPVYGAR